MKLFWTISLVIMCKVCAAQTLKTYSGPYEDGTATYQYYEDKEGERVLEGKFTYSDRLKTLRITGEFKNNKRTGVWKASDFGSNFYTYVGEATATYNDGNLNGLCTYTRNDISHKRVIVKSNATFKNNVLVGPYSFTQKEADDDVSMSFTLNNQGFFDGNCLIKYSGHGQDGGFEDARKYQNGYLVWRRHKKLSDGKIIDKLDTPVTLDSTKVSNSSPENLIDNDAGYFPAINRGLLFWTTTSNPLFQYNKGFNPVTFTPVKEIKEE